MRKMVKKNLLDYRRESAAEVTYHEEEPCSALPGSIEGKPAQQISSNSLLITSPILYSVAFLRASPIPGTPRSYHFARHYFFSSPFSPDLWNRKKTPFLFPPLPDLMRKYLVIIHTSYTSYLSSFRTREKYGSACSYTFIRKQQCQVSSHPLKILNIVWNISANQEEALSTERIQSNSTFYTSHTGLRSILAMPWFFLPRHIFSATVHNDQMDSRQT